MRLKITAKRKGLLDWSQTEAGALPKHLVQWGTLPWKPQWALRNYRFISVTDTGYRTDMQAQNAYTSFCDGHLFRPVLTQYDNLSAACQEQSPPPPWPPCLFLQEDITGTHGGFCCGHPYCRLPSSAWFHVMWLLIHSCALVLLMLMEGDLHAFSVNGADVCRHAGGPSRAAGRPHRGP